MRQSRTLCGLARPLLLFTPCPSLLPCDQFQRGDSSIRRLAAGASYYDLNSNVMLYALLDAIDNQQNGNWGPAGSAALPRGAGSL